MSSIDQCPLPFFLTKHKTKKRKFRPNWASGSSLPGDQTSTTPTIPGSAPPDPSNLTATSTLPLRDTPHSIPILGFGIYKSPTSVCAQSCAHALSVGYRHIDSAQYYENEAEMGEAVVKSGIAREEVFLTTKILSAGGSAEKTYKKCLDSVNKIDAGRKEGEGGARKGYVDLFLIHAAVGGPETRREMWLALERLYEEGRARAIGVSNFGIGHVAEMKGWGKVWPPHVNQLEVCFYPLSPPPPAPRHKHNALQISSDKLDSNLPKNHPSSIHGANKSK